ncbi:hypothetical protein MMC30_008593 [Trapelia coarctata]|nr:hypothetical protein [Trapelia coarctata]
MRFPTFFLALVLALVLTTLTLASPIPPSATSSLLPSRAAALLPRSISTFLPHPPLPPFPHGRCGVHVTQYQQWQGFRADAPVGRIRVVVHNPAREMIHLLPWTRYEPTENVTFFSGVPVPEDWPELRGEDTRREPGNGGDVEGEKVGKGPVEGEGPRQMFMTIHAGGDVFFQIGNDTWLSSDERCKVGAWDRWQFYFWDLRQPRRDMDCGFAC